MRQVAEQYLTLPGPNGKHYEINVGLQLTTYCGPTTHISDTGNLNPGTIPAKDVDVVVDMYGQPGQVVNFHNSLRGWLPLTRFVPLHPQTLEMPAVATMARVQPVIEGLADPPGIPPGYCGSTASPEFRVKDRPYVLNLKTKCGTFHQNMLDEQTCPADFRTLR